jgi:hypothetical protein
MKSDGRRHPFPATRYPLFDGWQGDGPFKLSALPPTTLEALIGCLIWKHHGRENPISIAKLRELTGVGERTIKDIVEQLVVSHKVPIGGRREEPVGYFIIENAEDQAAAAGPYKSQILAMLRRLRVLESPEGMREFLGQLRLEAER